MGFYPDYKNVENAARNLPSGRMPLYEHLIAAQLYGAGDRGKICPPAPGVLRG